MSGGGGVLFVKDARPSAARWRRRRRNNIAPFVMAVRPSAARRPGGSVAKTRATWHCGTIHHLATLVSDTVVRNLGVLLDQELSMVDHITKLSQVCFFHLRRIRVVRHSLSRNALLTLVHAFVCSRLDFCNSVMFGINSYLLDRLQSILNAAARLILQIPKFSSISSAIRDELHWLPVRSRIVFKHCLLVRSCIAGSAPVSGPHVWNLLPPRIRSLVEEPGLFKRELKHYLMQQHS